MRLFQKNTLRLLYIVLFVVIISLCAFAADEEAPLYVYPNEVTGGEIIVPENVPMLMSLDAASVSTMSISDAGIALIIEFEGFSPEPYEDYSQYTIGYGCNYELAKELFGEDCAPITEEQGIELLKYSLASTESYMNRFYQQNNILLNQNQYDALMCFTLNVGIGWTTYKNDDGTWCRLKTLLLSDPATWTEDEVQKAFGTWVNAGGVQLPGLVTRRAKEAALFCTPCTGSGNGSGNDSENGSGDENTGASCPFVDISPDAWYYDEVVEAYQLGLTSGTGDNRFSPDAYLTRAEMVMLLAQLHGLESIDNDVDTPFRDVTSGLWYTGVIDWAANNGYVAGCGDGLFAPEDRITREQMCAILARYLQAQGYTAGSTVQDFSDDASISDFARVGVYFCANLGISSGTGDNCFSPLNHATRAEAIAIILRTYRLGTK